MNRRKPRLDVAVVPVAEGEDRATAVLRKAARAALASAAEQGAAADAFTAGYLAGFARHQALKHGVEAEADLCAALIAELAALAPEPLRSPLVALSFALRAVPSPRTGLAAAGDAADAGFLIGHLESLCGTRKLLATSVGAEAYLTLCDHAADRLQTHQPTAALRLDAAERAVVIRAFASP